MTEAKRPLKVFLCHAHADRDAVRGLYTRLTQDGVDAWLDKAKLLPGQDWKLEIEKAVREADVVVVCLSKQFNLEGFRQREVRWALDQALEKPEGEIFIIPARLEECDTLESLRKWNWVDLFEVNGYEMLLRALQVRADHVGATINWTLTTRNPKISVGKPNAAIIVVLIMIGTVIAALANSPLIDVLFPPLPTPTENVTVTASVEVPSKTPDFTAAPSNTPDLPSTWQQGKIAYVARNPENVYFLYAFDLFQNERPKLLLSPDRPSRTRYYAPWFAPDGKELVFADSYLGKIFVLDTDDDTNLRLVGNCSSPSFSPDGKLVVCHAKEMKGFSVYDVKTGELVRTISHGKESAVLPAWSPDGEEIVFSVISDDGDTDIWIVSAGGGVPISLATNAREDYGPSWSPDGEWIAYQSTLTSEMSEIWIMRRDGSEKQQITFSGGGEIWSRGPCFSPDGEWLAFVSNQNKSDGDDFGDVFAISLITGKLHQITDTGGYVLDWRVTWSK